MPELTLRDGMVIVGSLMILIVVVDAWRRMRRQQRSRVRVRLATDLPGGDGTDDLALYRELPNGGARVVSRQDLLREASTPAGNDVPVIPEGTSSGSTCEAPAPPGAAATRGGEVTGALGRAREPAAPEVAAGAGKTSTAAAGDDVPAAGAKTVDDSDDTVLAGMSARHEEPTNLDWLEDLPPHKASTDPAPGALPRQEETEIIILHVVARDERGFVGSDILEILLACDLRFGDMSFFHRHEEPAGRGPIQFSVANMLQPGIFDIDNMEAMRTRGLVFFLTLPGPADMSQAYDYMLEAARTVARNLGGEVLDESRSVLTQQAVEHSRQQIRELERRLRSRG